MPAADVPMTQRMPALFIGHGSPLNTLADNPHTRAWRRLGERLPRPRAVLVISAHWFVPQTAVTVMAAPRTLHDFHGFPQALHEFAYPAPGSPELAARVQACLRPLPVVPDTSWGLDHGAWSVLAHLFPAADIPVAQLSLNRRQAPPFHAGLGARLAVLREEGVLILGSGNLVHNLALMRPGEPFGWASAFEERVRQAIDENDLEALLDWPSLSEHAALAVPTPEHFLPLLYVLPTRQEGERIGYPVSGIDMGSLGMSSVAVGLPEQDL